MDIERENQVEERVRVYRNLPEERDNQVEERVRVNRNPPEERENQVEERVRVNRNLPEERENQVEERVRVNRNPPEERDNQVEERGWFVVNQVHATILGCFLLAIVFLPIVAAFAQGGFTDTTPSTTINGTRSHNAFPLSSLPAFGYSFGVYITIHLAEVHINQVEERVRVNRNPPEERDNQVEERGWFVVNQVHATILGCFLLAIVFLPIVAAFAQGGFTDTTPSTTINGTRSHNAFPLSSLPAFGYSFGVYITIHLAEVHINQVEERVRVNRNPPEERDNQVEERGWFVVNQVHATILGCFLLAIVFLPIVAAFAQGGFTDTTPSTTINGTRSHNAFPLSSLPAFGYSFGVYITIHLAEVHINQVEERVRVNRNPPEERDNQVEERGWFVVNQVHATILGCFLLAIVFLPIVAAFAQGGFTDTTPSTTINGTRSHNAFPLSSLPAFGYSFGVYITIHLAEVHINQVEERVRVNRNPPEERDNQVEERGWFVVNQVYATILGCFLLAIVFLPIVAAFAQGGFTDTTPSTTINGTRSHNAFSLSSLPAFGYSFGVYITIHLAEVHINQVEERVRVNRNPPEERDNQVEERGWFVVNQVHATILGCFLLAIVFLPIVAAFAQGGFTDTTPSTTINGTRSHNAFPLSSLPAFGYSFGVYITIHLAEVHINPEHHTAKIWLDYLSIICACVAMIALVHVVFPLFALCFLTPLGAFALVVRGVIIAMTPIRYIWIVCKLCILNRRLKNKLFMEREASRLLTTAIDGTTRDVTQALVNTLKVEMASLDREINGLKRETGVVVADEEAQVVRDGGVRA